MKDNKFIDKKITQLNTPKTYEQFILEEANLTNQQDLYPELGYEDVGLSKGYGPCDTCRKDTQWVSLSISCPTDGCDTRTTSYYYHSSGLNASDQSGCGSLLVSNKGVIKCNNCGTSSAIKNWKFKCSSHNGEYKATSNSSFLRSLIVAGDPGGTSGDLSLYLSNH